MIFTVIPNFSEGTVKTRNKIRKAMWKTGPFKNNPFVAKPGEGAPGSKMRNTSFQLLDIAAARKKRGKTGKRHAKDLLLRAKRNQQLAKEQGFKLP